MTSFAFMLTVCPETFSSFDKVAENCPDFLQYGRRIFLVSSATKISRIREALTLIREIFISLTGSYLLFSDQQLFISLSIICICTMFSEVVLILQILWCRFYLWIDQLTAGCHLGNFLKNNCIMYCFMSILTPCKWSMVFAKYCRYCFIIFVLKQVYDQKSCIFSYSSNSLPSRQRAHGTSP